MVQSINMMEPILLYNTSYYQYEGKRVRRGYRAAKFNLYCIEENRNSTLFALICRQDPYTRAVLHAIESMVIKWSHQIQDIVEKTSAQSLLNGMHLDPQAELDFWKERRDNLSCIYDQVSNFQHNSTFHDNYYIHFFLSGA